MKCSYHDEELDEDGICATCAEEKYADELDKELVDNEAKAIDEAYERRRELEQEEQDNEDRR